MDVQLPSAHLDQGGLAAQRQVETQDGGGAGAGREASQLLPWAQGRDLWTSWGRALSDPLFLRRDLGHLKEKELAPSCLIMVILIKIVMTVQSGSQVIKGVGSEVKESRFES